MYGILLFLLVSLTVSLENGKNISVLSFDGQPINVTTNSKIERTTQSSQSILQITSPFYYTFPKYPNNVSKTWILRAPSSDQRCVSLIFRELSLENSRHCKNDFVQLNDGDSWNSPLIIRACGDLADSPVFTDQSAVNSNNDSTAVTPPFKFVSTKLYLFVKFQSDGQINSRGFVADVGLENCSLATLKATTISKTTITTKAYNLVAISKKLKDKSILSHDNQMSSLLSRIKIKVASFFTSETIATTTASASTPLSSLVQLPLDCGLPSIPPTVATDRIVGGNVARPHSWPWQASIQYLRTHICGGAVISSKFVISAAHCFTEVSWNPEDFEVWLGKHNKYASDGAVEQRFRILTIFVHEDYGTASKHDSDIALLELAEPAGYTSQISPVCLPNQAISQNTICYVTGFGETKDTGGSMFLKQTAVGIVSRDNCTKMDQRLKSLVTDNMLCAYNNFTDSCQGDSGGPLVCRQHGRWWLHGVVSFGFGCAVKDSPGVYTATTKFVSWLRNITTSASDYYFAL